MNTKTKNKAGTALLFLLLTAITLLEWKTGLAVAAVIISFITCYRIVNRNSKPAAKEETTAGMLTNLVIYDGILDTIDWD
jgi:hypothetical protein